MQSQDHPRKEVLTTLGKKSILFANNNLTYIQLGQLQKNIQELVQQNKSKYNKISDIKINFKYQLCKISQFQANSKAFGKQLLLRQMDRLLEQKNYLDRQLSLIRFHDQEETIQKQKMVSNETQHFQLLKSIWHREGNRKSEGTLEQIQELNLMVGQIKSNIHSLIKFESNDKREFEDTYLNTCRLLQQKNRECGRCSELMAKNQFLKGKLDTLEEKINKISDENIDYLEEINSKDDKLKKITKIQLKQEAQLKDRILRLDQQILKKDQTIKALKKQLHEIRQNKFVNENEWYQLYIRGAPFDLNKYHKKINISCEDLVAAITQETHTQSQLRVIQPVQTSHQRYSTRSKGGSTEGSSKDVKEGSKEQQKSVKNENLNEVESVNNISRQSEYYHHKPKNIQKLEVRQPNNEQQSVTKRYVRTGAKRSSGRSNSIMRQQIAQGFLSVRARGVSPQYGLNTE